MKNALNENIFAFNVTGAYRTLILYVDMITNPKDERN